MARYNIPSSPKVFTSRYEGFTGCDFNTDPMCVDDRRFPYAQNLVLDTNGYPEKRPGYKEVLDFKGTSHKLFRAVISADTILLVHAGDSVSVYKVTECDVTAEVLCTLSNVKSCFFVAWRDLVYVYGVYAGEEETGFVQKLEKKEDGTFSFSDAIPDAYVPETSISGNVLTQNDYNNMASYGSVSAGGQTYESVNLIGYKRINGFKLENYELVYDDRCDSSYYQPLKLATPHYFALDSTFFSKDDRFVRQLYGLYLRLYCVGSEDTSKYLSGDYSNHWSFFYGNDSHYGDFVNEITDNDDNGDPRTVGSYVSSGIYSEGYADALLGFLTSEGPNGEPPLAVKGKGLSVSNDVISSCYYLNPEYKFVFEVKDSVRGWENVPFFMHCSLNLYQTGPSFGVHTYLVFFYDFQGFEPPDNLLDSCFKFKDDDSNKNPKPIAFETSAIALNRVGFYHKSTLVDSIPFLSAFLLLPDKIYGDNFKITFPVSDDKLQEGITKIVRSDTCQLYGVGGSSDRVFVKGSGDEKHYLRFSEMDKPLYFPDLNYITCGTPSTEIVDMFPFSSYLCVAKEQNFQDVSFLLVDGTMMEGEAAFLVKEGLPGVSLKSQGAYALCDDIPHFLSDNGVFYLTSVDITAKTAVKNCSYFADSIIRRENAKGAKLFYYNSHLYLSFPESRRVYVFNTNAKAYSSLAGPDHYVYEVFLWTDVEAFEFLCLDDVLYFVTKDGKLMRFKEHGSINCYSDEYDGEHHAIDAYFKTKAFDDGSFMTLKNMRKRGCGAALKPFTRSSATIYVITDRDEKEIKELSADIFDWTYIDFVRFEFTANPAIRIMPFNTKVKKYATIQFYVRNNEVGESFGVIGLEKAYTFGNYKKN